MRPPLILAASIGEVGHVIYGSKCPSRVLTYNFTARALIHPIVIHSVFHGFIPDRFATILGCALICVTMCSVAHFLVFYMLLALIDRSVARARGGKICLRNCGGSRFAAQWVKKST